MFADRKRGRIRKGLRPPERYADQRIAAFRIVHAAIEERLGPGRNPFGTGAMSAAADAIILHPNAGDEQIWEFLEWFSSDANPMP